MSAARRLESLAGPATDELHGQPQDYRCERKYPLSASGLLELRWWLRNPGHGFERAHPPRKVNNIYFDSPDWDSLADNASGASVRTKCRLRWYGELRTADTATFEVKQRRHVVGSKRQQGVPMRDLRLASLPVGRLYGRLRSLLSADLRPWLDRAHGPVLFDRYSREYFATAAGIRITIDTDIVYALLRCGPLEDLPLEPSAVPAVLEVKHRPEQRAQVEETLRSLPFRATRCSKYALGVAQLLSP